MIQLAEIGASDADRIIQQERLSLEDRYSLQRFKLRNLANEYSDLSYDEIRTVHQLEEKNLYKIINSCGMLLGIYGDDLRNQVMGTKFIKTLYSTPKDYDIPQVNWDITCLAMALRHMLSNFNDNPKAWPVFDGKIPSRPFKFRQVTAETWFKDIVNFITNVTGAVYVKRNYDADEAYAFVLGLIAHHLHRSQPDKYSVNAYSNENDAIYGILKKYLESLGVSTSKIIL